MKKITKLCRGATPLFSFLLLFISTFTAGHLQAQVAIESYNAVSGTTSSVNSLTGVAAGRLLVLVTTGELHSSTYCTVTSSPSITWTKQVDAEAHNSGDAEIWTAVYSAGGNITITSDWPGASRQAAVCYVISGQESTLGGASAYGTSQSAPSVSITTTRANSIIIGGVSDWNAVDGTTRTLRDGATETFYYRYATAYTTYGFYKAAATVTSYTEGLTAPTGQSAGTVLYEIRPAAGDPDPSCVSIVSSNAATGSGSSVHSLTSVPAGALLVLSCQTETHSTDATVTSSPSLTWTKRADAEATSSGDAEIWTAVYSAGGSITVTSDFGNYDHSSVCYVITGNEPTLSGASANGTAQSAPSLNITTTRANSIIIGGVSDWNAVNGSSRAYRDAATETYYYFNSGAFTTYNFYKRAATATTYTEGLTAPTSQSSGIVLYEIRCADSGGDGTNPTPPVICFTAKTSTTLTIDDVTAATDNVGVTGYSVTYDVVGGSSPTTVNFSTFPYTITGLTSGSTYDVSVKAKDAATNQSTASNVITRKTLAPNLLFDEGFEDCNPWDNWTTGQDAGHAWSRQQSGTHANEGTHSFRAEVRSGCDGFVSSGYRSEILPAGMTDEGERWYGFSIYFDEPYSSGNWTGSYGGHFIQWHPDNGSGSASLALWGSEGEWDLVTNPEGNSNTRHHHTGTPITRGWHHFVIYVDWSSTAGKVKVWIDGSVVFDLVHNTHSSWYGPSGTESGGPELLDWNEEGRYLKFGINRWGECSTPSCPSGSQGPCDIWILYYDNLRIGDASADYNDVAPATGGSFRVANPVKPVAPVVTKPANYTLGQNYPNPFNKQSSIQFTLPKAEKVNLSLIDLNGRVVKVLMNASKDAGTHTVSFDAGSLAKGVYYYKIKAGNFTDVKKLTIQ